MRLRVDDGLPSWLTGAFADALNKNMELVNAGELEPAARLAECSPLKAARKLSRYIERTMPYRFDGETHVIASWDECVSRGYGACADAAALAGACLVAAHHPSVKGCYETLPGFPDYAHLRVHVAETLVEPWPHVRRPVQRCSLLVDLHTLLR